MWCTVQSVTAGQLPPSESEEETESSEEESSEDEAAAQSKVPAGLPKAPKAAVPDEPRR